MQKERLREVGRFRDRVVDIGAVIGDGAVDIGTAAHQVAHLAAETVTYRADLAVSAFDRAQEVHGFLHVLGAEVVVEAEITVERRQPVVGIVRI